MPYDLRTINTQVGDPGISRMIGKRLATVMYPNRNVEEFEEDSNRPKVELTNAGFSFEFPPEHGGFSGAEKLLGAFKLKLCNSITYFCLFYF